MAREYKTSLAQRDNAIAYYYANRETILHKNRLRAAQWYKIHKNEPEFKAKIVAYSKLYREKNKAACAERSSNWRKANPERQRVNNVRAQAREYGLTAEQYKEIQQTPCFACGSVPSVPDHDHKTNRVRGALCLSCNSAIGMVKDNVAVVLRLADYLAASQVKMESYVSS